MKRILFSLISLMVLVSFSFGQNKKIHSVAVDTVKGAETVVFNFNTSGVNTTGGVLAWQALCEDDFGGTSDGVGYLEMSVDGTSFVRYADAVHNDGIRLFASDTSKLANLGNKFTITDNGVFGGYIKDMPWKYYRLSFTGTSGDTTQITVKYHFYK